MVTYVHHMAFPTLLRRLISNDVHTWRPWTALDSLLQQHHNRISGRLEIFASCQKKYIHHQPPEQIPATHSYFRRNYYYSDGYTPCVAIGPDFTPGDRLLVVSSPLLVVIFYSWSVLWHCCLSRLAPWLVSFLEQCSCCHCTYWIRL